MATAEKRAAVQATAKKALLERQTAEKAAAELEVTEMKLGAIKVAMDKALAEKYVANEAIARAAEKSAIRIMHKNRGPAVGSGYLGSPDAHGHPGARILQKMHTRFPAFYEETQFR